MKTGQILREMRLFRNLTQQQLAAKLGVTKQEVSRLELADDCNYTTFQNWAAALDFEIFAFPKERVSKEQANFN